MLALAKMRQWLARQTVRRTVAPCLFAAVATAIFVWQTIPIALTHDFLNFYSAASLARDGRIAEVYDDSPLLQRQRELMPQPQPITRFDRPAVYAFLLSPLTWLPYKSAYFLWAGVQFLKLAASWTWAARRYGAAAISYTCLYIPPLLGIAHGQDCIIPVVALVAAYLLAERKREFLSGLVLGAGLFKFHLFFLWPLALASQKRWKMLAGLAAMGTAELLASVYLVGSSGVASYIRLLQSANTQPLSPAPQKVLSIWGVLANLGIDNRTAGIVLTVAGGFAVIVMLRRAGLEKLFAVATVGSLALAPHVYLYDAATLLLPIWLAIFSCADGLVRKTAILFSKPHIYAVFLLLWPPFLALPAVVLLIFVALAVRSAGENWGNEDNPLLVPHPATVPVT